MNRPLIQQFADYCATRTGKFETDDCEHCPMADFAYSVYPNAYSCHAGEQSVTVYFPDQEASYINFAVAGFFTHFIEFCPSWEELTLRLRRALA